MRAGLLIYGSLDTPSGGYLYDRQVAEHLRRQGDEVTVIALPWRDYARHLADNLSSDLLDRLRSLPLDVLLQDELNHPSLAWLNRRLRPHVGYPIITIVHNLRSSEARPAWQRPAYRLVERQYLTTVDGLVCNSLTTQQSVEDLIGPGMPTVVAYPAGDRLSPEISEAEITARARREGPLRIVFLANVLPGKGLHTLVSALAILPRERFRLDVAGSLSAAPAYARAIRYEIAAAGLAGQVELHGLLSDERLVPLLSQAHVVVVPSFWEGFGIAYLEGMGFGLPAIGSTAGAAAETITHGRDGYLVEPGDAAELATYLLRLGHDRQRLAVMGGNARRRYLAHPTWEQTAAQVRSFLRSFAQPAVSQRA